MIEPSAQYNPYLDYHTGLSELLLSLMEQRNLRHWEENAAHLVAESLIEMIENDAWTWAAATAEQLAVALRRLAARTAESPVPATHPAPSSAPNSHRENAPTAE